MRYDFMVALRGGESPPPEVTQPRQGYAAPPGGGGGVQAALGLPVVWFEP